MGAVLWALLGCVSAHSAAPVTLTGTLVPLWHPDGGGDGELVLRVDAPVDGVATVVYATPRTASREAAACLNGIVTLRGELTPTSSPHADAMMAVAEVVSCTPATKQAPVPLGSEAVLTGTLERRWRYGSPGYGANPAEDRLNLGAMLVLGDGSVVQVEMRRPEDSTHPEVWDTLEKCDGKRVTVSGEHRATKRPDARPPFVVDRAKVVGGVEGCK